MFLKESGLKSAMKQAYKKGCLMIGKYEERLYICGGYWEYECDTGFVPRSILGAVIEFAGRFPKAGTCLRANGEEVKEEEHRNQVDDRRYESLIKETPILIESQHGGMYRLFQEPETNLIMIAAESYAKMIDETQVDKKNGEIPPGLPRHNGYGILWKNNVSKYRIIGQKLDEQRESVLTELQAIDLIAAK